MGTRRQISCISRAGFNSFNMVWLHIRYENMRRHSLPMLMSVPAERIRKLDQHQGFVKGVCWDPVGEFLATQSDDRTVKIWKTTDWSLEAEVTKPFEDSPGSTFFRRLRYATHLSIMVGISLIYAASWSPDGAHITASNATNNKGYVFIAAVITRNTWTSEISLVGHENTVEVAVGIPACWRLVEIDVFSRLTTPTSFFGIHPRQYRRPIYVQLLHLGPMIGLYQSGRPSPHVP